MSANVLFNWSDTYNIGIQEVDEQHQVLVMLLNQLHEAIHLQQGKSACREILDRLAEYTRTHFLLEESLMRLVHYPDFEAHKVQHEGLIRQIHGVQQQLDTGDSTLSPELLDFLKNWLVQHIQDSDRRFGAYFPTAGLDRFSTWSCAVRSAMKGRKWRWKFW